MSSQRVHLEIHAANLTNTAGTFRTSDPYAVVTLLANNPNEQPRVLGKTEVIPNSLNPRWITHFDLDYCLGQLTRINVGVYDDVKKGSHKPMGSAMFEVGEVLGTRGNVKAKQLRSGGTLFVRIKAAPSTGHGTLHLKLHGHQLKNVDGIFGTSDPFFELSYKVLDAAGGLVWQPIYRSEPIKNDLNPSWSAFAVDIGRLCAGDFNQPIQFKIFDWQKNGKHTWMGTFETNVNALLVAVVAEPRDKKNVDTSKAFRVLKRGRLAAGMVIVTEARLDGKPTHAYSHATQPVATASSYAAAAPVAFYTGPSSMPEQYAPPPPPTTSASHALPSFSQALDHAPPSTTGLSVASYVRPNGQASLQLPASPTQPPPPPPAYAPSPLASPKLDASLLDDYVLPPPLAPPEQRPSFVEYLSGGLEIELCIAIDFTGSNGDPRVPGTLHYMDPSGQLNDYEKAITAVGDILGRYDVNQRFPTWGFGAKFNGEIQHCFQVGSEAELFRLSGVVDAYRNVFKGGLVMSGPTVFAEVINMAAAKARSSFEVGARTGRQTYTLLLILTDGEVSDINLTKEALHSASDAPLSVIIVGIGNAEFSSMNFLDNFQANAGGKHRDICQFVEFNRFHNDKQALTRETLQEIPDQLVAFFWSRGIKPLPPLRGSQMSLMGDAPTSDDVDLNMSFGPNGELSLADYTGAVYDDTKYSSTLSSVTSHGSSLSKPVLSPPLPHQPYDPGLSGSSSTSSYNPSASIGVAGGPYVTNAPQGVSTTRPSYSSTQMSNSFQPQSTSQTSQAQPPRIFHAQAPPNSHPGMQLRVTNPHTGQDLIVTIPNGVLPGGKFGVR